jgi:hypothetical protein
MRARLTAVTLTGLAVVAAVAVLATQSVAATSVSIGLHDYYITHSVSTAVHGIVTFNVKNDGAVVHNFRLRHGTTGTLVYKSVDLAPGAGFSKSFTLKAGSYEIYCSIHKTLMHFIFKVT